MTVGWSNVSPSRSAGSGRFAASELTTLAPTSPAAEPSPATSRRTIRKLETMTCPAWPRGRRAGAAAWRAARTARARGDSLTRPAGPPSRRRAGTVIRSAGQAARPDERPDPPKVLDLAIAPARPGRPEAVEDGDEVAGLVLGPAVHLERPHEVASSRHGPSGDGAASGHG